MHRGYIKIWRKTVDTGHLRNPQLWTFWCWCLLKATHKPINQQVGFQMVPLVPGQFIFGRRKAALALNLSEQTIRTCLKSLKINQQLTIKTTNKYSIITIVNWDSYQEDRPTMDQQTNQQANQPLTNNQPTTNQQLTTNKHKKHINTKNSVNSPLPPSTADALADPLPPRPPLGGGVCVSDKNDFCNTGSSLTGSNGNGKTNGSILKTYPYPDWLDKTLWADFHRMRSRIRKPITTKRTIDGLMQALQKAMERGATQHSIIQQSIDNCWLSFYSPKDRKRDDKEGWI